MEGLRRSVARTPYGSLEAGRSEDRDSAFWVSQACVSTKSRPRTAGWYINRA
ncbi:hypothetical protein SALBM311S_00583 [Streptomyces alboniger]